jgi:hypothetical protein
VTISWRLVRSRLLPLRSPTGTPVFVLLTTPSVDRSRAASAVRVWRLRPLLPSRARWDHLGTNGRFDLDAVVVQVVPKLDGECVEEWAEPLGRHAHQVDLRLG